MGVYGSPNLGQGQPVVMYPQNKLIYCQNCGFRYAKKLKKCPQCGKKCAQPFYHKWWFWLLLFLFLLIVYANAVGGSTHTATTKSTSSTTKPTSRPASSFFTTPAPAQEPAASEEAYKENCETLAYKDVARDPNKYVGKAAVFRGNVIQVQENGAYVVMRVNVIENGSVQYDSTLYVEYQRKDDNESRVLEGDTVKVYGKMNGIKTYESVFGNQVSIPHLLAEYVEVV